MAILKFFNNFQQEDNISKNQTTLMCSGRTFVDFLT